MKKEAHRILHALVPDRKTGLKQCRLRPIALLIGFPVYSASGSWLSSHAIPNLSTSMP